MRTRRLAPPAVVAAIIAVAGAVWAGALDGGRGAPTATAILEIVDSRAARMPAIDAYKAGGVIGENKAALVEIVDLDLIEEPDARAEVERVVRAENADRERLYALLAAVGGGGDQEREARVRTIRERYAVILRDAAHPGEWIQLPDGSWERKK